MGLKNYCGTAFKLSIDDFGVASLSHFTYCKYALEICPKTGRKHVQWWGQSRRQISTLRIAFGHTDECKGTPADNDEYVSKSGTVITHGEFNEQYQRPRGCKKQGERNDLKLMIEDIKNGADEKTIMEAYPGNYIRMNRTIRELIDRWGPNLARRDTKRIVHMLVGPAGSGKTRMAHEMAAYNCKDPSDKDYYVLSNQDNTMWWRGYRGQKTVIIDDFKGGIKYSTLLGILDPWYNCRVATASGGDLTWFTADRIIITSTMCFHLMYPNQADFSEVTRRVKISEVKAPQASEAPQAIK